MGKSMNIRDEIINVRAEVPREYHERLKLEVMRRARQGQAATIEAVINELIIRAANDWPRMAAGDQMIE